MDARPKVFFASVLPPAASASAPDSLALAGFQAVSLIFVRYLAVVEVFLEFSDLCFELFEFTLEAGFSGGVDRCAEGLEGGFLGFRFLQNIGHSASQLSV